MRTVDDVDDFSYFWREEGNEGGRGHVRSDEETCSQKKKNWEGDTKVLVLSTFFLIYTWQHPPPPDMLPLVSIFPLLEALTCQDVKTLYQDNACCDEPDNTIATPGCVKQPTFMPSLEATLDQFMMNGRLLNKFPIDASNTSFSSAAFASLSVQRRGQQFHKTWGVDSKTKVPYNETTEVPTWFAASTKLVANIMGLYFWERNVIDLDEPVWKYLPEYHTDGVVTNRSSVYPLHVLRPILSTDIIVNDTVVTRQGNFTLKKHVFTAHVGSSVGQEIKYYEQPVPLDDYPTMRMFMTHTDGSLGYIEVLAAAFDIYGPDYLGLHMLGTDLEMTHCDAKYGAALFYGPFINCNLQDNTNKGGMASYAQFGKLIFYPGRASHYNWGSAVVGRLAEVAYERMTGTTGARFEDVVQTLLWDKVGANKSMFYVTDTSELFSYYNTTYASGVVTTATADSSQDEHNWNLVPVDTGGRYTFASTRSRALGDAGMVSTARDYLKMMNVALSGLTPDGTTRILRPATARMLSKAIVQSHVFDSNEFTLSNGAQRVLPTFRTLGGSVQPFMPKYAANDDETSAYETVYTWEDRGMSSNLETGFDNVEWGGDAGSRWIINHEDEYLFSFQTNIQEGAHISWLVDRLHQIVMDNVY
jgi:CubicO group peptidase (beta-lactamase class C family)